MVTMYEEWDTPTSEKVICAYKITVTMYEEQASPLVENSICTC
jgi:hypothetical protein